MRLLRDDNIAEIAALLRVDRVHVGKGLHDPHDIWAQTCTDIPLGTALAANVIAGIRAGFANGLVEAVKLAIAIYAEPTHGEDYA